MFNANQLGKVNANAVGKDDPETLLIVEPGILRRRALGWNCIYHQRLKRFVRAETPQGDPPFLSIEFTMADMEGVTIEPASTLNVEYIDFMFAPRLPPQ